MTRKFFIVSFCILTIGCIIATIIFSKYDSEKISSKKQSVPSKNILTTKSNLSLSKDSNINKGEDVSTILSRVDNVKKCTDLIT